MINSEFDIAKMGRGAGTLCFVSCAYDIGPADSFILKRH
jgi:hypothetical protein